MPPSLIASPDLTAEQFRRVAALTYAVAGISLPPGKEGLVRSRLAKRLRTLALDEYDAYLELVEGSTDAGLRERAQMIDALTTNKTSFYREAAHFAFLRERVLPALDRPGARPCFWSAGCSTGEEPYTLGMVLQDGLSDAVRQQTRILATDISPRVLEQARAAEYSVEQIADVPEPARRWLEPVAGGRWRVREPVRRLVAFAHLNLMEQWPMRGPFDAIFCRNVMIYFDKPTQARLVNRYHALLRPGGFLFVGHSESLSGLQHPFTYVQPAVYAA